MTTTHGRYRPKSRDQAAQHGDPLDELEVEVVALLAAGHDQKQTALELRSSDRTVRRCLRAAQIKLGARTAAHLVALAIRDGWIEVDE